MGLRDNRTLNSFVPRRGRDNAADRKRTPQLPLGTIAKTTTKNIFRAPYAVKIIKVSLVSDTAVPSLNESFWDFQIINLANGVPVGLNATPQNTTNNPIAANVAYDILADTGSATVLEPATVPSQIMKQGDVLALQCRKTGSILNLSNVEVYVEYEVTGLTTTTSSSSTTTTTTTTTTSTSTSTSSTTTTTVSTSSSTTSTSTSTTTTTTTSTTTTVTTSSTTSTSTSTTVTTSSTTSTSISTTSTIT